MAVIILANHNFCVNIHTYNKPMYLLTSFVFFLLIKTTQKLSFEVNKNLDYKDWDERLFQEKKISRKVLFISNLMQQLLTEIR